MVNGVKCFHLNPCTYKKSFSLILDMAMAVATIHNEIVLLFGHKIKAKKYFCKPIPIHRPIQGGPKNWHQSINQSISVFINSSQHKTKKRASLLLKEWMVRYN